MTLFMKNGLVKGTIIQGKDAFCVLSRLDPLKRSVHHIDLRIEIVDVVENFRFFDHRRLRAPPFRFAVVAQNQMLKNENLFRIDLQLFCSL